MGATGTCKVLVSQVWRPRQTWGLHSKDEDTHSLQDLGPEGQRCCRCLKHRVFALSSAAEGCSAVHQGPKPSPFLLSKPWYACYYFHCCGQKQIKDEQFHKQYNSPWLARYGGRTSRQLVILCLQPEWSGNRARLSNLKAQPQ